MTVKRQVVKELKQWEFTARHECCYLHGAFFHLSRGKSTFAAYLRYAFAYKAAFSSPSSMSFRASEGAIHFFVRTL